MCLAAGLIAARAEAGSLFPDVEYITLPTPNSYPLDIATGPLGDVWFTENNSGRIGRIGPGLQLDEFTIPREFSSYPTSITAGPDGNMWFIDDGTESITRITPAGTITQFPAPSEVNDPFDITSGPDGRLWFTERTFGRGVVDDGFVASITINGTINETRIETAAFNITRGPDDALWFTTRGLGRFSLNGQYRVFPTEDLVSIDVTSGPDGALWFTYDRPLLLPAGGPGRPTPPTIGRMTTDGVLTSFFSPDPDIQPNFIIRGPEDNLWFTTQAGGVWRINLAGTMEQMTFNTVDEEDEYDPSVGITAGGDGRIYFTLPASNQIAYLDSLQFLSVNLANATPIGLARGADDSIWFADYGGNRIGRIDKNGSLRQHEIGPDHYPTAVAVAPDGSAWFTNSGADTIGHITVDGDFTEIVIRDGPSYPQDIVLGPDGNFWFTESDAGAIGRITPQGVVRRFPVPNPDPGAAGPRVGIRFPAPLNITVGPDGNLWFTDPGLHMIGRITTGGDITMFPIPTAESDPSGITAGADGHLYFVESRPGRVARISTAGVVTELGEPDRDAFPQYITLGPDGAIWFTEADTNRLGRIARDGRITKFELPSADSQPAGIVGRSDGRLFVALLATSQIIYTDLAAAEPTHTATATPTATRTVPPGSTATATSPPTATATPTEPPRGCDGDCDGDGAVSINELILAVNIALDNAPQSACLNADADNNGVVVINDLIAAVNSALQGCPA